MNKLFAYPGGKWPIRNLVVACMPPHTTYVDVFGGSASILIAKDPSKGEVFNDKNQEIVNFFRIVKHRPAELAERAKHWIHSRKMWYELKGMPKPEDEVERAFRFWALLADSFGSMGMNYGTTRLRMRSVTHAREYLDAVAERLRNVHVENLDFQKCITTYDAPETLFYLDPPYRGTKGGDTHYDQLSDDAWKEMKELLGGIKGKFLLSSNWDIFVLRLFREYWTRALTVRVSLPRSKKAQVRKEALISNYQLPVPRKRTRASERRRVVYSADKPAVAGSTETVGEFLAEYELHPAGKKS